MSKFLQLIEVYEVTDPTVYDRLNDRSQAILQVTTEYALRKVLVNTEHVTLLREDAIMKDIQELGKLPKDLDDRTLFTKLYVSCGSSSSSGLRSISVVGSLEQTTKKILELS